MGTIRGLQAAPQAGAVACTASSRADTTALHPQLGTYMSMRTARALEGIVPGQVNCATSTLLRVIVIVIGAGLTTVAFFLQLQW